VTAIYDLTWLQLHQLRMKTVPTEVVEKVANFFLFPLGKNMKRTQYHGSRNRTLGGASGAELTIVHCALCNWRHGMWPNRTNSNTVSLSIGLGTEHGVNHGE